jgi:hypothetical protein
MDQHPLGKIGGAGRIELKLGQIQPALPVVRVMALETILFKKLNRPCWRFRREGRPGYQDEHDPGSKTVPN